MSFGGNSQIPGAGGAGPDLNHDETLVRAMLQGRLASRQDPGLRRTVSAKGFVGPLGGSRAPAAKRVTAALTAEDLTKRQAQSPCNRWKRKSARSSI
jgi:hypothetical protein